MKDIAQEILKLIAFAGAFIACIVIVLLVIMTWEIPFHEYKSWILEKNFREAVDAVHLQNSILLATMAEVGNWGNSNHCDYVVGQFRSSSSSREALQNAYVNLAIPSFHADKNGPLSTEVYFAYDEIFLHYPWSDWLARYAPDASETARNSIYLVWASSDDHPPGGDVRCH